MRWRMRRGSSRRGAREVVSSEGSRVLSERMEAQCFIIKRTCGRIGISGCCKTVEAKQAVRWQRLIWLDSHAVAHCCCVSFVMLPDTGVIYAVLMQLMVVLLGGIRATGRPSELS